MVKVFCLFSLSIICCLKNIATATEQLPYNSIVCAGQLAPLLSKKQARALMNDAIGRLEEAGFQYKTIHDDHDERVADLRDLLAKLKRTRLAKELYSQALTIMIENAVRARPQKFPFDPAKAFVRQMFQSEQSWLDRGAHILSQELAKPWSIFFVIARAFETHPTQTAEWQSMMSNSHQEHDQAAAYAFAFQLNHRLLRLNILESSDLRRNFPHKVVRFFDSFVEEQHKFERLPVVDRRDGSNDVVVRLPSFDILPVADREQMTRLLSANVEQWKALIAEKINAQLLKPTGLPQLMRQISTDSWTKRWSLRVLDLSTLAASAVFANLMMDHGSVLPLSLAVLTTANIFNLASDRVTDQALRSQLNEWFFRVQTEATIQVFHDALKEVFEVLSTKPTVLIAEQEIEHGLAYLRNAPIFGR